MRAAGDAKFFFTKDTGIPDLMRIQHVAEQGKTPVRQVALVHAEFFHQLLVEVVVVGKNVFEERDHENGDTKDRIYTTRSVEQSWGQYD